MKSVARLIAMLTAMLLLAAACGGSAEVDETLADTEPTETSEATEPATDEDEAAEATDEDEATETSDEKVELTMYYPIAVGGALTDVVDGLVADFEAENPNIDVNAIYSGNYDETRIQALAAFDSGEPADLSVMFSIDLYELIEQDVIVPFDDLVTTPEDEAWLSAFYPGLMENGQTADKTWGVPFQRSTIVMYYNKDMFREAGLDPEAPPSTWDEMLEAANALTSEGERHGLMIPSAGYPYWMFGALAWQNDQVLMNSEGTEVYFDTPGTVEALEFWKALGSEHNVIPEGIVDWGTLRENFLTGKTAMMWHSTGNLTAVKDNAEFDFGVAMLPGNVHRGTPTGGGNFYILKNTSEAEQHAAFQLIKFLTAPEKSATWSMATGYMGIAPEAYETAELQAYTDDFPAAAVARDQLDFATAELSTFQAGPVRKALDDAIQAALTGQKTPAEALAEAQATADGLLAPYQS